MLLRELLRERDGAKEENRSRLLRTIMAKPGSQVEISRRSGLSPATVSEAANDLANQGLIKKSTSGGRTNLLEMEQIDGAAVGVELGFQYSSVVARRVDQSHSQAEATFCRYGVAGPRGSWVTPVAEKIRQAVSDLGQRMEDIGAIGLGVPRMIQPQTAELTPPLLPPWDREGNPAAMLANALRTDTWKPQVLLDNDANLAALAESTYSFHDVEILVSIKASTGIGAGIVVGGKMFRGVQGIAGEIGHTVIEPTGRYCSCGGRGCLETLIGADALVEQAKTVLGGHRRSPETLEGLIQQANDGDLVCQRVLREAAGRLGFAIGNLCNILNPQVVVIGGALGREPAGEMTLGPCWDGIRRSAMAAVISNDETGRPRLRVEASKLPHAAAHGALVMALTGTVYQEEGGGA